MWSNEYWPLLIQAYLAKPEGAKSQWSRWAVDLAMELHLRPNDIADRMKAIGTHTTPATERLLAHYKAHPRRLQRDADSLHRMAGFGSSAAFYDGVETAEQGFESLYRPTGGTRYTPAMLVIMLDLYFRLIPATMVETTPEVRDMARRTHLSEAEVTEVLHTYLFVDPSSRKRSDDALAAFSPLTAVCAATWHSLADGDPATVQAEAQKFYEYYRL